MAPTTMMDASFGHAAIGSIVLDAMVENKNHSYGRFYWRNQLQSSLPVDGKGMENGAVSM